MAALRAPACRLVPTTSAPAPWGDAPRDWPVLLRPASEVVVDALTEAGLAVGTDGAIQLLDDLLVNAAFVRAFLAQAPPSGPAVAAVAPSLACTRNRGRSWLATGEGPLRVPLVRSEVPLDRDGLLALARDPSTPVVVIDPQEQARVVPVPRPYADPDSEGITFSASARVALHLTHRTHLLQANLDLLGARFLGAGDRKAALALRYVWDRLRPGRVLLSRLGARCKVHPTAIVEACQLGDGVEVGAYAVLRGCVIGDGALIEDGAHAQLCVMGPRSRLARQTSMFISLLMEGAHSAQAVMQASVLGRDAATTSDSWFSDVRVGPVRPGSDGRLPGRTRLVRVEAGAGHPAGPEALVDSGSRLLGCTVGHETFVGAGVVVAPGRSLPGGLTIVGPAGYVLGRTALDGTSEAPAGSIVRAQDGRLETLTPREDADA